MWAITKTKNDTGVELREWPELEPTEDEVLIKVTVSGICGSDLHLYNWRDTERSQLASGRLKPMTGLRPRPPCCTWSTVRMRPSPG